MVSSVTFVVTSNDYFDGPSSTTRVDIVKWGGTNYLDQTTNATGANWLVAFSINTFGAQKQTS